MSIEGETLFGLNSLPLDIHEIDETDRSCRAFGRCIGFNQLENGSALAAEACQRSFSIVKS